MYADDTHLTYASNNIHNIQTSLNEDLENVHNWLRANKLTLNMTKTEFMLIGSGQRLSTVTVSPALAINDFRVTQVATSKSLGLTIDDNLDCGSRMEKIIKKVSSRIGAIKRVRHFLPKAALQLIYLIYSPSLKLLQYCLGKLWDNPKEQTSKTTKIEQPVFWHFQTTMKTLVTCLNSQDGKNLARQHEIEKATMVSKSLHGLAPEYLCSRFAIRETAYNLRDSENKLYIPLPRTNYYKNSFSYSNAILWNNLPCNVRQAESLTKFKCLLKQVL